MESKTKTGAPRYCYCMKSATTATTTPSRADAAFLLLPLLLVLVLLGCCFVCTPWPANKDCGPVVVVTGGVSTTKGKNEKKRKYTSSGTGCQLRLQASQTKQSLVCYFVLDLQTKTAAPCVVPRPPPTTTPTCKQRLRPRVLFQARPPQQPPPANKDCGPMCCSKAPPHNNPHLQTKTAVSCVVPRPSPHNNPYLQTKTAAPCVVPRPPPHNNPHLQTKTVAPCVVPRPPPQQPPCCCWMVPMVPTNKDWSPVVLVLHA